MPSIRTSTWLASVPRRRTWVWPAMRLTATPGTSRRMSETARVCRWSSASASSTVIAPPFWSMRVGSLARVPVTTMSGSFSTIGSVGPVCAHAGAHREAAESAAAHKCRLFMQSAFWRRATRPGRPRERSATPCDRTRERPPAASDAAPAARSSLRRWFAPGQSHGPGKSDTRRAVSWLAGHRSGCAFPDGRPKPVRPVAAGRCRTACLPCSPLTVAGSAEFRLDAPSSLCSRYRCDVPSRTTGRPAAHNGSARGAQSRAQAARCSETCRSRREGQLTFPPEGCGTWAAATRPQPAKTGPCCRFAAARSTPLFEVSLRASPSVRPALIRRPRRRASGG